jgi:dihydroorotase
MIKQAKDQNLPIYTEACPHHLFLNTTLAHNLKSFAKVNPPLRGKQSQQNLLKELGSLVDTVATDHAPHTREEKNQDYNQAPSGCPGIEHSLALMLNYYNQGKISLKKIAELMCQNPARIFNIKKRGKIKPGYFADLIIIDLNLTKEIKNSKLYTKSGWSPFAGQKLTGWPVTTIVNGKMVFQDGKIIGKPMVMRFFKK